MAKISTYLNFRNQTEEAFNFYKSIFGGEFASLQRFSDIPGLPGQEKMTEEERNGIMHVVLPILGGHELMGTDAPETMGFQVTAGNNIYINVEPDTREETDRLFKGLSEDGRVLTPLQEMFWGDYYGACIDKFNIQWMFNCSAK